MLRLPVMVAAGGINSAGRTSRRHAYRRMIWDHLPAADRAATESALSEMMGSADTDTLLKHTLVREIEKIGLITGRALASASAGQRRSGAGAIRLQPGWHR